MAHFITRMPRYVYLGIGVIMGNAIKSARSVCWVYYSEKNGAIMVCGACENCYRGLPPQDCFIYACHLIVLIHVNSDLMPMLRRCIHCQIMSYTSQKTQCGSGLG